MAKNMWGKQPPKKQAYTPPTLSTPSFWGPAPVPPKVYQTWAAIRGEGRDGSEYEDPEGIDEGGAHDSWVSQFSKRFATDPVNIVGTGRDGNSADTEGGDEGDGQAPALSHRTRRTDRTARGRTRSAGDAHDPRRRARCAHAQPRA